MSNSRKYTLRKEDSLPVSALKEQRATLKRRTLGQAERQIKDAKLKVSQAERELRAFEKHRDEVLADVNLVEEAIDRLLEREVLADPMFYPSSALPTEVGSLIVALDSKYGRFAEPRVALLNENGNWITMYGSFLPEEITRFRHITKGDLK